MDEHTAKNCLTCGRKLKDAPRHRKFCGSACRQRNHRRVNKAKADKNLKMSITKTAPEHIKDMVYLAFGADSMDVVRQVMREEIRSNITQAVQDNVLGAAEMMTQMLPKALGGLLLDLNNQDYYVRGRAQQLVLKYAMPLINTDGDEKDLGKLKVIHEVSTPNTPLGERVAEHVDESEAYVEEFEKYWPVCESCHVRKHPDAMYVVGHNNGKPRLRCKPCSVRRAIEIKQRAYH